MFKKNTKLGIRVSGFLSIIGAISFTAGILADFFGAADGLEKRKDIIGSFLFAILSFLASYWIWGLIISVLLLVVIVLFKWKENANQKKRLTESLRWFEPDWRNTKYTDREDNVYKVKSFLRQKAPGLSWWSITGVAGIGKTRLVIEVVNDHEFSNSDIRWLKTYNDYRETALKASVDSLLESSNLYNIIIAENAQIYMDNVGLLIGYISSKTINEIGDHMIRLLILIRKGENENLEGRYKQLKWGASLPQIEDIRFKEFGDEIRLEKYSEEDIDEVVKSFAVNTKKNLKQKALTKEEIADLQKRTKKALQKDGMDPNHLRPLFAMFITDAILSGKDPMSWDRKGVLDYAVLVREEMFWKNEVKDLHENIYIFDNIRNIICLSIIRDGVKYTELQGATKELEEQLSHAKIGVKDFLKEMQLIGYDEIVRVSIPDILSEYYVLQRLVIKPEESTVNWIIEMLCNSLEGTDVFRKKVRQDFSYLYGEIENELRGFYSAFFKRCSSEMTFSIIKELLAELDLHDSNAILLQEAIGNQIRNSSNIVSISNELVNTMNKAPKIEEKRVCLTELEQLSKTYEGNYDIDHMYGKGLVNMLDAVPKAEEKQKYFRELKQLSKSYKGNYEIALLYGKGLGNMLEAVPEEEGKQKYLAELKMLSKSYVRNADIAKEYARGLFILLTLGQERECIEELKQLSNSYEGNIYIALLYGGGVVNTMNYIPKIEERRKYLTELNQLFVKYYAKNIGFAVLFGKGLFNILTFAPEVEEKRVYLAGLKQLSKIYERNYDIKYQYARGLFNMRYFDDENHDNYIHELCILLTDKEFLQFVVRKESKILLYTRKELLEYEPSLASQGYSWKLGQFNINVEFEDQHTEFPIIDENEIYYLENLHSYSNNNTEDFYSSKSEINQSCNDILSR